MKLISIITVNYRQLHVTVSLLHSLKTFTRPGEVEVIVVDNGSTEDCHELLEQAFPGVIYVRSEKNLGFAGGNNLGISQATGDFVLFLNNDVEIAENIVPVLTGELEKYPDIGLLSPLILYFDDKTRIQYAGYTSMNYYTGRNNGVGFGEVNRGQYGHMTADTGFCHGAAMICRRACIDSVGLMDESYFLYYEELDWCEKFKKAGWRVAFTGKTAVFHKESITVGSESPLKTYFMMRNRWLFIRRNAQWYQRFIFGLYYLMIVGPRTIIKYMIKRRADLVKAAFKGVWWNVVYSPKSKKLGW